METSIDFRRSAYAKGYVAMRLVLEGKAALNVSIFLCDYYTGNPRKEPLSLNDSFSPHIHAWTASPDVLKLRGKTKYSIQLTFY